MTAKELIEELERLPEDTKVFTYDGEYSELVDIHFVQVIRKVQKLDTPLEPVAVLNNHWLDDQTVKWLGG